MSQTFLTNEQVGQFRAHGFVAVPDFWSADEVSAMRSELDRLAENGKLRNVATDGDGVTRSATKANLQLCPLWPHSDLFRAMPFAPQVASAVGALLGGDVLLHLDQVFVKPGQHGVGTNWHQDNAYFHIEDPLAGTALWTAVHDATIENGTLRVIPDSFDEALPHERDPQSDHHIRCYPDETRAMAIEIKAGGAIFFAYGTPHATGANATRNARAGVALHFLRSDQNGVARGGFEVVARPKITGNDASGGAEVHGIDLRPVWKSLVESL